jgi:DNA-binding NtrC family response regulator
MQAADIVPSFSPSFSPSIAEVRLRCAPPIYLGYSPAARRVQGLIARATRSQLPVLLVGAPGTGKETIARILHHFGGGEAPNLEIVDARDHQAGLGSLGAFTYLARLEDLTTEEQLRLPMLTGLGRIVIGTELRPESAAAALRLHPDTVRWASAVRIDLPSLAERIEDLEMIAMSLIARLPSPRPICGISDDALDCLRSHRWPGNLDELAEVIQHAMGEGTSEQIELCDLPARIRMRDAHRQRIESPERQLCLEEVERQAIRRALQYARGNKRKAARLLRIGKTTLYRKLEQYGIA